MNAFFAGIVFGALFMGAIFVVFITKARSPRRDIAEWREDTYQQPPVTTRIVNRHRSIEL